jgi:hypothetical protein
MKFRIVALCLSIAAAILGLVSLAAGLHRMSLSTTCFAAGWVCYIANELRPTSWWRIGAGSLWAAGICAFFLGIK